jgi:hypothetical protein
MTTSFTTTPTDDDDDSNIINRIFVSIIFKYTIGEEYDSNRVINFIIAIMTTFCFYSFVLFAVKFISIILNGIMNIKKFGINNNSNNNILSFQFYLYLYNNLFGTNENKKGTVVTEEEEKSIALFHGCRSSLSQQPVQVRVPSSRDENRHHRHQRQLRQRTTGKPNKQQDQLHLQRFQFASPSSATATAQIFPSSTSTSPSVLNNNRAQQLVDAPHHSYASTIPIPNKNKQQLFALSSSSSSSSSTTGGDGHAYHNNNNNNSNPYHPIISQEQHQVFLQPRTGDHHHHQQRQLQPQQQPKALATASVSGEIVVAPAYQHNAAAWMSSVTIPAGQPKQHHQSDVSSINYFTYDSKDTHDDGMEEWNEDEYNKRFSPNAPIKDTTTARNNASTTTTTTTLASASTDTLTTKSTKPATKKKSSSALPTTAGTPGSAPGSAPGSGSLSINKKKRSRRSAALELSETEIDQHDVANIQPQQQEQPRPSKKQRLRAEAKARAKEWNARIFGN